MFNPVESVLHRPINAWMLMLLLCLGGLWALLTLGRLEDPAFTIKKALVITPYPGATALEVEAEITEPLESAIQQLPQLRRVTSRSMPGLSEITVEISDRYTSAQMPQAWDELRRRVHDAQSGLPPGHLSSRVIDDFGDVFGLFYAVTAEGFSDRELRDLERFLRRELLTLPGVGRVTSAGLPSEAFYLEVSHEKLTRLGLPIEHLLNILQTENSVEPAGQSRVDDQRLRWVVRPGMDSLAELAALRVGLPGATEQLTLADLADVKRLPVEYPDHLVRINGQSGFTLGVAGVADTNIVDVGQRVEAHLEHLSERLPLGVTLHPIYQQHEVVDQAVRSFMLNLLLSVTIVISVLCVFMGWRVGVVVGATLFLTVMGTLFFMRVFSIEMERVSLGALIIAMGMLVDNAIVVAEGMLINRQRGMTKSQAATEAVGRTQMPLLAATVIGILAFAGIGLSPDQTGEFLFSLFQVILISLLLSWVLAIWVTPLLGSYLLKPSAQNSSQPDPYQARPYGVYRRLLAAALKWQKLTFVGLVVLTLLSFSGFGWLRVAFFPDSNTPLFYVHYQLPQGSHIWATSRDIEQLEDYLLAQPEVVTVSSFVGQGASRFMLTYEPVQPDPAYAQLIVEVTEVSQVNQVMQRLRDQQPDLAGQLRLERPMFGPGVPAQIEARFSGSDIEVLRQLGHEAQRLFSQQPGVIDVRLDWQTPEPVLVPIFHEQRGRHAGISRQDLAQALMFSSQGVRAGSYREGEDRIPLIARLPEAERLDLDRLDERMIWSPMEKAYIPMTQVVERFELRSEEALIHRRDRSRTLTVQAEPGPGFSAAELLDQLQPRLETMSLPLGYSLSWGGEHEVAGDARSALIGQLPISFIAMWVISVLLFGRLRQALVIWLVVPMAAFGVVAGLFVTGLPFGFLALLGFLSLSGMLMKNAIVLVDEIDQQIAASTDAIKGLSDACVSRLRPVFLAASTTILGMLPLLFDAFFASMAVTIMAGLAFATLLTLVAVPVIYAILLRVKT